jgi:fido (protein-threonine AMPylation protein)
MATPQEKLASSLTLLHELQNEKGITAAIRAKDLSRTHRTRLVENGFLTEVMKGWYMSSRPEDKEGDTTAWYASYWHFCGSYLEERFGNNWSLSTEQSLLIHSGNWTIPKQLLVRAPGARNKITHLLHNTSLYEIKLSLPNSLEVVEEDGLRMYSLSSALVLSPETIFTGSATDTRIALLMVRDSSYILNKLLEGGHSVVAGRLAGAFRNVGMNRIADDIVQTMGRAGYNVREKDPFTSKLDFAGTNRPISPYVYRIRMMWQSMREVIIEKFPKAPGLPKDIESFMRDVQEGYENDAYHSLSIEGYKVTPEMIQRVRSGTWNPEASDKDKEERDALAARGYHQAYQAVLKSLSRILTGESPGQVADEDHGIWYQELFEPSVRVGLIRKSDLAGYRNGPVYIRGSNHTPLNRDAVRDAMPALFDLFREETNAAVRVVLGHFIFVFIHPYMDGNGRIGRFLMNSMLVAGGYPWTVVPLEKRKAYMDALEKASVDQNIEPFAVFIAELVSNRLNGMPLPEIPNRK